MRDNKAILKSRRRSSKGSIDTMNFKSKGSRGEWGGWVGALTGGDREVFSNPPPDWLRSLDSGAL